MAAPAHRALLPLAALALAGLPLLATLFSTLAVLVPPERVRAAIVEGFASRTLTEKDYPWFSVALGMDQFTDCLVLESALYRGPDPLRSALGAHILDPGAGGHCHALHLEVSQPGSGRFVPYYRYWHGNKSLELVLIGLGLPLRGLRWLLHAGTYAAIVLFAAAAFRRSHAAAVPLGVVALFGACFSVIPFMGSLLSHAPGYLFVWLAAAWLVLREARWSDRQLGFFSFAAGFTGTVIDMLASMPFLALMPLVAVGMARQAEATPRVLARALLAGVASGLGIVWSTLSKQLLAAAVFGWDEALGAFSSQLALRLGAAGAHVDFGASFGSLLHEAYYLSFGSAAALPALVAFSLIGLLLAAWLARGQLLSPLTLAANAGLFAWYFVFKNHTANHPQFMVRFLFLPCAWGWALTASTAYAHWRRSRAVLAAP